MWDGASASRWIVAAAHSLETNRAAIDAINVFPVADSDTGTNLLFTLRAAADGCLGCEQGADLPTVLRAASSAAVTGARGNSGMIVSQLLQGMAGAAHGDAPLGAVELAAMLVAGARNATASVREPMPGTMLSVLHEAVAAAARAAGEGGDPSAVAEAAALESEAALARTPTQLEPLARAGVVDAGGRGVVLLLDALAVAVNGARLPRKRPRPAVEPDLPGSAGYGHEVMYRLDPLAGDGDAARVSATLGDALGRIGDCVSVVGDGNGSLRIHVHCDDVGAALQAGLEVGTPADVSVTALPLREDRESAGGAANRARAVLAVVEGASLADLFRGVGAVAVNVAEDREPGAVYSAIRASGAASVTLLPQHEGLVAVCHEAAELADAEHGAGAPHVVVVPTASPAQGLAALAVHDPARRESDDDVAMAEAAAATRRGALVVADREALTWAGRCVAGDVLGMIDGEVVFVEHGPPRVEHALRLVDALLAAGGELVTALLGADPPQAITARIRAHLRTDHPEVELMTYDAAIPDTVLAIGVE